MKLLLDTHVLVWSATAPDRLLPEARAALEDGTHEALISIVTAWEIAMEAVAGKARSREARRAVLPEVLRRTGYEVAELSLSAALRVRGLAWHHRDPFDRLLIAQALEHGYTLVSRDAAFEAYGVPLIRA